MSTTISKNGEVIIARVAGRLDTTTAPESDSAINEAIGGGALKVVVDFAEATYISSAGLRVLLKTAKTLHQKSGKLGLCGANEQILEVLEMSGFLTMMQHYESQDAALEAVA